MAYTTIDDPSAYFQALSYSGAGGSSNISRTFDGNSDLQPDLTWHKSRGQTYDHYLFDSTRGVGLYLKSNAGVPDDGTSGDTTSLASFDSDGFTLAASQGISDGSAAIMCYGWKCNGGTETHSQSESGSNIACSVQANTTAKFSIITYTGTGGAGHTFLHGLGSTPKVILIKIRTGATRGWIVYHHKSHATPHENFTLLNTTAAVADLDRFDDTAPNSTEIAVSDDTHVNADGNTYVAYAFDEVKGYSKFGSYTGNGNANGAFVYTGFKPAFVIQKQSSANGEYWMMKDNAREPHNQADINFYPNANNVEGDTNGIDFLSNGFKCRTTGAGSNASSATYIYMAWAESPFVSSEGVPTTAR